MTDFSDTPLTEFYLASVSPEDRVSEFFTIRDLMRSDIAARNGIDNAFASRGHLQAAVHLARQVLDVVRSKVGSFSLNSVYRTQDVERILKKKPHNWKSGSQHTLGEACDLEVVGIPTIDLARRLSTELETFDQIICECFDPRMGPNAGWVHVSTKAPATGTDRRQVLSYVRDPTKQEFVYVDGLRASP